ncbi:WD40-repeat-containing domain protein [Cyathus striatus]|nr:WD40-repeat-containing domain protein [Cyathus striatus]
MYIPSFLKRNTESYVIKACLRGSKGPVNCIVFSHSATLLASGGDDETLRIWDVGKKLCQQALEDHCGRWGQITSIKWFPAAFHELSNTRLFTVNEPVESISIDPVHQRLAASSHMGKVKLCSIHRDGSLTTLWIKDFSSDSTRPIIPRAVHFYDSYKMILVFFLETGEIHCHLSDSGTEDWHKVLKSPIGSAAICESMKTLLIDNMNGSFDLYQISKASPAQNFEVPTKRKHLYVKGAALALCSSDNGRLHLYSTLSSSKIQTLCPGGWRLCIQAVDAISSSDCKLITSSSSDKKPTIYVWKKQDQSKNASTIGILSFMNMLNFLAILFLFWLTADVWKGYVHEALCNVVGRVHTSLNDHKDPTSNTQFGPINHEHNDDNYIEIEDNSVEKSKWGFKFSG